MAKQKVKVYSTQTCPLCYKLKDWLKENKVEFQDIDVCKDMKAAQEMIKKSGQMGVPVAEVGDEIIVGFDVPRLKKALRIK